MTKEESLEILEGRLITKVRQDENGYTVFVGDLVLKFEGCPYNDSRCEQCSCDKRFRATLEDCRLI